MIEGEKEEIIRCWRDRVQGSVNPSHTDPAELIDTLPGFLDQLAAFLRTGDDAGGAESEAAGTIAVSHGSERFHAGFSLAAIIREYGILRECVLEFARDRRLPLTIDDLQKLLNVQNSAITHAVMQFTHERDQVIERQSQEHFAFIAHELRNPLGSAQLAAQTLQRRLGDADNVPLQRLLRNLSTLSHLIDNSLVSIRIRELGRNRRLDLADVSLRQMVDAVVDELAGAAEGKGVSIHVTGNASTRADPRLIRSAIANLLGNAVKYTASSGAIQVRIGEARGLATLEIEDQCGGLPEGTLEELFTPFVQRGPDRSGFGLGLAITKDAIEAHQGSVEVANVPGKGCVFMISLPASAPAA